MKQLNTGKAIILALNIPDNANKPYLATIEAENVIVWRSDGEKISVDKLPFDCEVIGIASEITEEQAKELVPAFDELSLEGHGFEDYTSTSIHETALESWHSFMTARQINPNSLILKKI